MLVFMHVSVIFMKSKRVALRVLSFKAQLQSAFASRSHLFELRNSHTLMPGS